jgi:hypothetical protein
MRSLIVTAIWLSMLIPSALAQTNSSSTTQSDRIDAAKRETADLEKARIIEQLRQSNLRSAAARRRARDRANAEPSEYGAAAPGVVYRNE